MLLHIGPITIHFHFQEIPNVFIFMIFRPSEHVHDLPNPLFLTLDHQCITNNEQPHIFLENVILGNLRTSKNENVGKDACRQILEVRVTIS